MTAHIKIGPYEAAVNGGQWQCSRPWVQAELQKWMLTHETSGADPNPDETAARAAAVFFGGEFVRADPLPYDPDVIY